jgi:hypothetical protein
VRTLVVRQVLQDGTSFREYMRAEQPSPGTLLRRALVGERAHQVDLPDHYFQNWRRHNFQNRQQSRAAHQLRGEIAAVEAQLSVSQNFLHVDAPQIRLLAHRVRALKAQQRAIEAEVTLSTPPGGIWDLTKQALEAYAEEFLEYRGTSLHVEFARFGKWQDEITGVSPLPIVAYKVFCKHGAPERKTPRGLSDYVDRQLGKHAHRR